MATSHYWNSHCRSYVCACARETHTMRGRHTEEKNKETENRNEKETHDKTALRKEEIMLSTKPTGGNNTKIIQHNHQNQLTCAHTYGRAHPDCTDSYCRTWSEHRHTCSHFSLYQAHTGRPWTTNLHRWAEKSLVQVNTGIRLREDVYFNCAFHSVFFTILVISFKLKTFYRCFVVVCFHTADSCSSSAIYFYEMIYLHKNSSF